MTSAVDQHLARFTGTQRRALDQVRATLRAMLPGAEETVAYNIPTFAVDGINVVGFSGFAGHNSLFPYGRQIVDEFADELTGFSASKGTIRFPKDEPFPAALLKRIVRRRIELVNATFPTKKGETKEFYDNGFLKQRGRVRGEVMEGRWEWFRRDGSLMRSGSFHGGEPVGEWTTYDRNGAVVKVTDKG